MFPRLHVPPQRILNPSCTNLPEFQRPKIQSSRQFLPSNRPPRHLHRLSFPPREPHCGTSTRVPALLVIVIVGQGVIDPVVRRPCTGDLVCQPGTSLGFDLLPHYTLALKELQKMLLE